MNRRTVTVFATLSILVAVLAAALVAYRVLDAEGAGRRIAADDFDRLSGILAKVSSAADLADPNLRRALSEHYARCPSLLLVAVYERGSGLRWRIPAESPYLPSSENQKPFPEPAYPDRSALRLSAPLASDATGRLAVDAVYSTLPQTTVFSAFRDSILLIGAYLAAAAAALAIISAVARPRIAADSEAEAPRAGEAEGSVRERTYAPPEEDFEIPAIVDHENVETDHVEIDHVETIETGEGETAGRVAAEAAPIDAASSVADLESIETVEPIAPAAAASTPPPATAAMPASGQSASVAGLYSPDSGLGWEEYLSERLDAELARSASFEQDLSVLALSYGGSGKGSPAYRAIAKAITEVFTFRDLAFERGDDGFSVVIPNMDIDSALRIAEEFLKKLTFLLKGYRDPLEFLPLYMGLSSRAGRLVDANRILQETSTALQKARDDRDTHIVAFRPDADKYRLYLAAKGC